MRIVQRFRSVCTRRCEGGVRRRGHHRASCALVASSLMLLVTGCMGGGSSQAAPASQAPSTTSSQQQARAAILSQYRQSYKVTKRAERVAADQRRAMLAPYLAEPHLSSVVEGIRRVRQQGRLTYGLERLHPYNLRVRGNTATLHDCQDNRHVGQKDAETGEKLTRGVQNLHLVVTMERGADGRWRVKHVREGDKPCGVSS